MKEFNDTGLCVAHKHYMVNTLSKFEKLKEFITKGKYFAINRPRQFGKTTTLSAISRYYADSEEYVVIRLSFEGIGDDIFKLEHRFCVGFCEMLIEEIQDSFQELAELLKGHLATISEFKNLSVTIKEFVLKCPKKIILVIDEVDKSSNNQLFVNFIAMLRDKYLKANDGKDFTFHSVILAGVHDVKTLKLKIRSDGETKLNSPWNIAADFDVDMTFNPLEISTMLVDYAQDKKIEMDIPTISERIYYYTSGYPYLVSKMCKVIDEKLLPEKKEKKWLLNDIEEAYKFLSHQAYTTTLFDDLIKNLENNPNLYSLIFSIVINGESYPLNISETTINLGIVFGILSSQNNRCVIQNRIFEQRLFTYFVVKQLVNNKIKEPKTEFYSQFFIGDALNFKFILQRFQQFMRENYSKKDNKFLEREGRLIFLSYLKPIINGKGYDFKEPVVGDERRIDVAIIYNEFRYIVELKLWRGAEYHQRGLQQLSDYLDLYQLKEGFLLIYDFRKEKEYKEQTIQFADKQIFAVWI